MRVGLPDVLGMDTLHLHNCYLEVRNEPRGLVFTALLSRMSSAQKTLQLLYHHLADEEEAVHVNHTEPSGLVFMGVGLADVLGMAGGDLLYRHLEDEAEPVHMHHMDATWA
jgi:hypothetical protein